MNGFPSVSKNVSLAVTLIFSLILVTVAGCSRIPEPATYAYSEQNKMQAAHHWNVLAADVANRINNELIINDYMQTPVYIKTTCGSDASPCGPNEASMFDEAFRDLLITQLVGFGVPVHHQPIEDALTINYKVQMVQHTANRIRTVRPGLITALTTGVMVLRDVHETIATIAFSGLVDFANQSLTNSGHYEVIITTSMVNHERYFFRFSDIYYINDLDIFQYQPPYSAGTEISLVSGRKSRFNPIQNAQPSESQSTSQETSLLPATKVTQ